MKVDIKDAPKSQKEVLVEIPYEKFKKACSDAANKLAKTVKIHGFRPGKAPIETVNKKYKHEITNNALEEVINNSIKDVFTNNHIHALSQPEVKNLVLEDDAPLTFSVFVDVFPEINLEKYTGFTFDRTFIKINDEDVDTALERLLDSRAEFKPLTTTRSIQLGDKVTFDFEGRLNGELFDGGTAKNYDLEIGSNRFIKGFEEQMLGLNVGETKDLNLQFPEDYGHKELAGKDVVFKVTINAVNEKSRPELNEEFALSINPKAKTVAELKELIKKDLQYQADQNTKYSTYTKILNKIIEENPFEVPNHLVKEQAASLAKQRVRQYYQMGIDPESAGINMEQLESMLMPEAEPQIKRALTINKIIDNNKIEVSEEDVNNEIENLASLALKDAEEIKKEVLESKEIENSLKNDILSNKTYDFLCSVNTFNDKHLTKKEFDEEMANSKNNNEE